MRITRSALMLGTAALLLLSACGGSSPTTPPPPSPPPPPPTGLRTGVISDSPVDGIAYSTSSGLSGTTSGGGKYDFRAGDQVTFRLGALTLGTVPATGLVTPIELAAGNANMFQNLLIMLQSLDADRNPDNGITIQPASATAVTTGLDLTQAPATFASGANTVLIAAMTAGGISGPITTPEAAKNHLLSQFTALVSSQIWTVTQNNLAAMVRILPDGSYQLGLVDNNRTDNNREDEELGRFISAQVDVRGYTFRTTTTLDKNPLYGFGGATLETCERARIPGALEIRECDDAIQAVLTPADNDPAGIVGAWFTNSSSASVPSIPQNSSALIFFANGTYLLADTEGQRVAGCGSTTILPHTEYGTYTYDATTGRLRVTKKFSSGECHRFTLSGAEAAAGVTFTIGVNGDPKHARFFPIAGSSNSLGMYRLSK